MSKFLFLILCFLLSTEINPQKPLFDVIIVGGSYAGLSAAMGLGRSLFKVLIIDSGERCNKPTLHSHNLITHDGSNPGDVAALAKEQVLKYKTVEFLDGKVISAVKKDDIFEVGTEADEKFTGRKLLFATGLKDKMLPIPGFAECWGNSVHHCPFCHGYEVRGKALGVMLPNGKEAHYILMIYNLSKDLKIFTNGPSTIPQEWKEKFEKKRIPIIESEIQEIEHDGKGQMKSIILKDGSKHILEGLFAKAPVEQHLTVPKDLGCTINEMGFIQVDEFQKTNIPGVFAAGDCTTMYRALPVAIAAGTKASALIVMELVQENFNKIDDIQFNDDL